MDHNHDNGDVRGLLCDRCNRTMGHCKDDIDLLQSCINYLKTPPRFPKIIHNLNETIPIYFHPEDPSIFGASSLM